MPVQSGLIPGAGYQDFIDVDYIWIHLIHCMHHQGPLSLFHGNLNKTTKGIKALATRLLLTLQPASKSEFEAQLTANMKRYASIVHHMTLAVISYHAIAQNPRLIEAQLSTTRPKDMNQSCSGHGFRHGERGLALILSSFTLCWCWRFGPCRGVKNHLEAIRYYWNLGMISGLQVSSIKKIYYNKCIKLI